MQRIKVKKTKKKPAPFSVVSIRRYLRKKGTERLYNSCLKYMMAFGHTRVLFPPKVCKAIQYRLILEFVTGIENYYIPISLTREFTLRVRNSFHLKYPLVSKFQKMLYHYYDQADIPVSLFEEFKEIEGITSSDLERTRVLKPGYKVMLFYIYTYQSFDFPTFRFAKAKLSTSRKSMKNLFTLGE